MFKPHVGICICHGKERMIVVKSGLCKLGNETKKGNSLKSTILKTKPIPKVSKKRRKVDKLYLELRILFLLKWSMCQFKDCKCNSTDVHHKKGRGENYLNTETWMSVCRKHHTWIETHPKESYELGYSQLRLAK